jgi:hypothetical protein
MKKSEIINLILTQAPAKPIKVKLSSIYFASSNILKYIKNKKKTHK